MEEFLKRKLQQRYDHLTSLLKSGKELLTFYYNGTGVLNADLLNCSKKIRLSTQALEKDCLALIERFPTEQASADSTKYLDAQLQGEEMLVELETVAELTPKPSTSGTHSLDSTTTKLPQLELAKFSGDTLQWHEFYDKFDANVHCKDIKNVVKLSYLMSMLEGQALQAVQGLSTTNDNYDIALNILKTRFGSRKRVIDAHYAALNNLKKANHASTDCRQTLDQFEKHLRVLQSMGEDINSNHLRVSLLNKFPDSIIYQVNLLWTDESCVQSLRDALEKVVTAMERSTGPTIQPAQFTTETLHIREGERRVHKRKAHFDTPTSSKRGRMQCEFCREGHYSDQCQSFPTVMQRKRKLGNKCFRCLRNGHLARQCQLKRTCVHCNGRHDRSLCPKKFSNGNGDRNKKRNAEKPKTDKTTTAEHAGEVSDTSHTDVIKLNCLKSNESQSCLQTATAIISSDDPTLAKRCRLLLDSGSQRSYLTTRIANELGLTPLDEDLLMIYTFGSNEPKKTRSPSAEVLLTTKRNVIKRMRVNIVPHITGEIPFVQLPCVPLDIVADDSTTGEGIDLLIGNDYYFSFMKNEQIKLQDDLYLVNTDFGWIMSGKVGEHENENVLSVITYNQSCELGCPHFTVPDLPLRDVDIKFLWALESIGIVDSPKTTREEEAVSHFNRTTLYRDSRYEVKWPWIQEPPDVPTNYGLACGRLKSLIRRIDQESLEDYNLILKEQLEANVIELVEPHPVPIYQTSPPVHYLPHHMVKQKGKRGRIVYDASAKLKDQKSLNECMYRGPSLLEDLLALLLKFRVGKIGILADIEKAFLQVGLQEEDRDVTRFLWAKDPTKELSGDNLLHFRFCRVPFGIISSPFLLTATIRYHMAKTDKTLLKEIADKCYVDNLVTTAETSSQAKELYHRTSKVFEELSMNIRDWSSNDQELIEEIPVQYRAKETRTTKVLGLLWDLEDDTLQLKLDEAMFDTARVEKTKDKRSVLRTLASFYDPCGYAAPLVLPAKLLLQELWKRKVKWDTPLNAETCAAWKVIMDNLQAAKYIKIPRYIGFMTPGDVMEMELHCFTDASKDAYSAVVYLRVTNGQDTKISFIMSKSRVTPIKEQENLNMPRLELLGYLIGSRLLRYVESALGLDIRRQYLWSDSLVVLSWVKSNKLLPPFVQRRVDEIRRNKNVQSRYVNTDMNPADLATRPELWQKKKEMWFNGPQFLSEDVRCWPSAPNEDQATLSAVGVALDDDGPDVQNAEETFLPEGQMKDEASTDNVDSSQVYVESNQMAETTAELKRLQRQHFQDEVSNKETHLTRNLGLYLDVDGLLRCRGRMANATWTYDMKHPVLIPKSCDFTNKVIQDTHERNYHVGVGHTLSIIRQQYWIPQGRAQVQKILRKCARCVKHGGGPYKLPPPPALPAERANYSAPFTYTGLDYLGPLVVETSGAKEKRWVCLFTCLAVRAIHLEVVKDLTAQECLLAFRRFVSCRGLPAVIVSDNATQFKLTAEVLSSPYCTENRVKWKFIPQLAPWHGGFYERLVGLVKHCLKRTLEKHLLTDSQLATVMKEIEAVVNTRPLTCVGAEPESVLRPSDFLTLGRCITAEPSNSGNGTNMTITKYDLIESWKRGRKIVEEMKSMFTGQYLPSLRERYRHSHKQPRVRAHRSPQVGDVVQIKGDLKNRDSWKVGRIASLIQGSDGECRVAKVDVGGNEFTRSIAHLYPLEVETDNSNILVDTEDSTGEESLPQVQDNTPYLPIAPLQTTDVEMTEVDAIRNTTSPGPDNDLNSVEQAEPDFPSSLEVIAEDDQSAPIPSADHREEEVAGQPGPEEPVESASRPQRAAAIQARQKIAEWTSQLAVLLC